MEETLFMRNLCVPTGEIDVVLDTDAYNEIDDQFALAYLLRSEGRVTTKAIYAAPFLNERSVSAADGMEKSYDEILRILRLAGREDLTAQVYKGSCAFLQNESDPVISPAAEDLAERASRYSQEKPLYVVAIGAITNVASALLLRPEIKESIVVVWLGGHAHYMTDTSEFNMKQDVAAARIVFGCGVPLVQVPCDGAADRFATTKPELEHWLRGKSALADYLVQNTIEEADSYAKGRPWSRIIWDVTAVAWLLNDDHRFLDAELVRSPIPEYNNRYTFEENRHNIQCVTHVRRDELFADLFEKLGRG